MIVDETYKQQLQNPFNPRFSSGDANFGDLSFFQYLSMKDFSGGEGQEEFEVDNRFFNSEGVDVLTQGQMKLAPKMIKLADVNGPESEHLDQPIEEEEAYPQIVEWLGAPVIYNDKVEYDAGGTEFLEVFETEIIRDKIINRDGSGTAGNITNDTSGGTSLGQASQRTRCEIVSISKNHALPGESIQVVARFTNLQFDFMARTMHFHLPTAPEALPSFTQGVTFRLDFGGDAERQSASFATQELFFDRGAAQFEFIPNALGVGVQPAGANQVWYGVPANYRFVLARAVEVSFTIRVPAITPGIYKLWTSAALTGAPFPSYDPNGVAISRYFTHQDIDPNCNANVLFFVDALDTVPVIRKSLYAPQLKGACVAGDKLVGARTYNSISYIEVYQKQSGAVDRTLQLSLTDAGVTPVAPTYMELFGGNGLIIAALDNRIYKIDIDTDGLTATQRFTFVGTVPGDYVSGMTLWNQRVYIASFDKSLFKSTISWTDLTAIQGSYAIDGKFWITDIDNYQGGLFYSGGTQDRIGKVFAYPAAELVRVQHPVFDCRIRSLNAGRVLYASHSHGTGNIAINERGVSKWAKIDLGEEPTNVVWGLEEVGADIYMLADGGFFKTTDRYQTDGFLETSELGAATPLIEKIWSTITIECRQLFDTHSVRVLIRSSERPNWTLVGTMTAADGLSKDFLVPVDFEISQWAQVRLELHTDDELTTPIVRRVLMKYVPAALQRWQWVFSVRADDTLKLLDRKYEKRTGKQIAQDIKDLKSAGQINFKDLDDTEYKVILTDMSFTPPLIDENRLETIVSLELLEA